MKAVDRQGIPGRHRARVLLTLVVTIGAVLLSAGPAEAHNVLVSSNPAAGSVLTRPPATIVLVFDQDVQNIFPEMAITVGSQAPVDFVPTVAGRNVSADLSREGLVVSGESAGMVSWKVGYRVVSADGHPVTGLVDFSVGTRGPSASPPAPDSPRPDRLLPVGAGIIAAVALTVVLLLRRRTVPDRLR